MDALDAFMRRHGITRFVGLLAVPDIVLHHHTGATSIRSPTARPSSRSCRTTSTPTRRPAPLRLFSYCETPTVLPPAIREALRAESPEDDLPQNTYYSDGCPIEPEVLLHLRAVYQEALVRFA